MTNCNTKVPIHFYDVKEVLLVGGLPISFAPLSISTKLQSRVSPDTETKFVTNYHHNLEIRVSTYVLQLNQKS